MLSKIFINIFHWPRYSSVLRSQSLFLQINISNKIKPSIGLKWKAPPASIYQLKVNNRNTRTGCEICSKLTIKTRQWRRSGVCIINFEHISLLVPLFLLLPFNMKFPTGPSHANRWSINWKMSKIPRGDFTWVKTKLHFQ